jgi:hypothetical protein
MTNEPDKEGSIQVRLDDPASVGRALKQVAERLNARICSLEREVAALRLVESYMLLIDENAEARDLSETISKRKLRDLLYDLAMQNVLSGVSEDDAQHLIQQVASAAHLRLAASDGRLLDPSKEE